MKHWIIAVTLALALAWSGLWAVTAWSLKGDIDDWFEARRSEGWRAEYAHLSVRGFPSRVDVTLSDVTLQDPARGTGWEGPFFQILGLTYKPGHHILVWPDRQVLTLPSGAVKIDSSGLRASLINDGEGRILRANLEAATLNLDGPDRVLALAGLKAALQQVPGRPMLYRLGVSAEALAGPHRALTPGSGTADGLQVQAEVAFDRPWTTSLLTGDRPQPTEIDLRLAEYRFEGLELNLAGRLQVDDRGRADGETTLRAVNWREMLDQARSSGQIPDGLARTLESGLALAAGLNGNRETLDLTLSFDDGQVALGVIPLGEAPQLTLP